MDAHWSKYKVIQVRLKESLGGLESQRWQPSSFKASRRNFTTCPDLRYPNSGPLPAHTEFEQTNLHTAIIVIIIIKKLKKPQKSPTFVFEPPQTASKKTSQDRSSKDAQRTTSNFQITTIPTPTSTTQSQTYRFSTHLLTYVVTKSPLTSTQLPTLSASLFMPRFTHPVIHTTTNNPENTETGQLGRILC